MDRIVRLRRVRDAAREVAHDLKNRLGVAIASIEQALSKDPAQREDLERALHALDDIDRTISVCQRILRGSSETRTYDVANLVAELVEDLGPALGERAPRFAMPDEAPLYTTGDPDDLYAFLAVYLTGTIGPIAVRVRGEAEAIVVEVDAESRYGRPPALERLRLEAAGSELRFAPTGLRIVLPRSGSRPEN